MALTATEIAKRKASLVYNRKLSTKIKKLVRKIIERVEVVRWNKSDY